MSMKRCECYCLPEKGRFVIGDNYVWRYIIDGIEVFDNDEKWIYFDEMIFLWYFKRND